MIDAHHILFPRQEWSLRPDGRELRESSSLITRMDRDLHNELHRECPPVPALGFYAMQRTFRTYEPGDDSLESMEYLMRAIESSTNHPKSHDIDRDLSGLAIRAIDLQRPFIAESLAERKRLVIA